MDTADGCEGTDNPSAYASVASPLKWCQARWEFCPRGVTNGGQEGRGGEEPEQHTATGGWSGTKSHALERVRVLERTVVTG